MWITFLIGLVVLQWAHNERLDYFKAHSSPRPASQYRWNYPESPGRGVFAVVLPVDAVSVSKESTFWLGQLETLDSRNTSKIKWYQHCRRWKEHTTCSRLFQNDRFFVRYSRRLVGVACPMIRAEPDGSVVICRAWPALSL